MNYHFFLNKDWKVKKFLRNLHDKNEHVIHIKNLNQALNHELLLKKEHRAIKFNQNTYFKPYININTDLRKAGKAILKKTF